jgi:hypothetical protein
MPVTSVPRIYREHLYPRGNGIALWYPDDEVHPGDVGFLTSEDGTFRRLFNILVPPDHPLNSEGTPQPFEIFVPGDKVRSKENVHLVDIPIVSNEVKDTAIELSAHG